MPMAYCDLPDYAGLGEAVSETAQDALMTLDGEAQSQLSALILALVSDIAFEPGTEMLVPAVNGFDRLEFEAQQTGAHQARRRVHC